MSDTVPSQTGLQKQILPLSPLLFNFGLEYAIRKVEVNQKELKLIGTHRILSALMMLMYGRKHKYYEQKCSRQQGKGLYLRLNAQNTKYNACPVNTQ